MTAVEHEWRLEFFGEIRNAERENMVYNLITTPRETLCGSTSSAFHLDLALHLPKAEVVD